MDKEQALRHMYHWIPMDIQPQWKQLIDRSFELESVQRERDEWKSKADGITDSWRQNVRALRNDRDNYQCEALSLRNTNRELESEIESLQRTQAELIEVLEWYGDDWNYESGHNHGASILNDKGNKARTILSKIK
ncbi:hypothetical protein [Paenibacillus kobensis]|uniref:hypothetical protein n=1 Tax=Paenibacillus kobensis TaxID=59841 RepID=UPI000FDB6902|nr:hypothetical protein [Paenibacillus kobensis]